MWASLVAQMVKNPPEMQETQVQPLGREDPLEKGMVTHSSILAWRIHGQSSLAVPQGYSPWGHKESDTIERLTLSLFTFFFIAFLRDTIQPIVAPLSKFSIDLLGLEY